MDLKSEPQGERSGRGSVDSHTEPRFLVVGQVVKPHGVRGDIRVFPHTDNPERFSWLDEVYIGDIDSTAVAIEYARFHKDWVLLKLAGCNNRDAAENLRGTLLLIREDQAIPLEEDEYFLFQLIGLAVISDDGEQLGELVEVIETGANNVFVVHGQLGEILIPDTAEVVREIDFDRRQIIVHILPGLIST